MINRVKFSLVPLLFAIIVGQVKTEEVFFELITEDLESKEYCSEKIEREENTTIKIVKNKCRNGEICNIFNSRCYNLNFSTGYDNDICESDTDCKSGLSCEDFKCMGYEDKDQCLNHYHCKKSSYCNSESHCEALKKEGQECDMAEACGPGLYCIKKEKDSEISRCMPVFSLKKGEYSEKNEFMCEDYFTDENGYCAFARADNLDKECTKNEDCGYTVDNGKTETRGQGKCETNGEGKKYCTPLTSDSAPAKKIIELYKDLYKRIDYDNVHTADRQKVFLTLCSRKLLSMIQGPLMYVNNEIINSIFGTNFPSSGAAFLSNKFLMALFTLVFYIL